ncbi:MAG: heparan-alpha-glucosaminide N-acetyltransferase domain-containing protein [Clostridia bacterium]|nr:heparan-alpha-glucosaminide N-acetyltransferase domain-containing protein [Clostridia bacterium]
MNRYYILDNIRAAALLSMILYHAAWDAVHLFGANWPWFTSMAGFIWQQSICCTFIALSGFCFAIAKKPLKRALTVLIGGAAVSAASFFVLPDTPIYFGILTFLGSSMLIMKLLLPLLEKTAPETGLAASVALFASLRTVADKSALFGFVKLPDFLYKDLFTAYFGFPPDSFATADYFPLLPWLSLFAVGFFLCRAIEKRKMLHALRGRRIPLLSRMGRLSFEIYLLHQPAIYFVLLLMSRAALVL